MWKNQYIRGLPVPEMPCEQEVWAMDKSIVVRRLIMDPAMFDEYEITGGRWARAAACGIASDMLAIGAIKVSSWQDYEDKKWRIRYVARVGTSKGSLYNITRIGDL